MNNIKKNMGYQTLYEILNTCLPLITAPYLARVLGAEKLGIFSYTQSIANYFVLCAMLGVKNYGTRSIAEVKDDRNKCNIVFNEIFSLQVITASVSLLIYLLYCFILCDENILVSYIQAISIMSCIIDINWLFSGLEKFKITVIRSTIIRVLTVILILLLVKKQEDLWIYTVLMLGGTFLGTIAIWHYVPQIIGKIHISLHGIKKHLKPNLLLFFPLMAMSVYHLMDKTMLGALSTYEQTGFYYNADKVINIPIGIITGIGTVMLPRITNLISHGDGNKAKQFLYISIDGVSFVAIGMLFGIIAIIEDFVPFFFGPGYDQCIILTIVLAPVLYIKALSLTIRNEYLIPNRLDSVYLLSVVAGAISNLFGNFLLIPKYGAMGAVIGTIVAELVSCVWQIVAIKKDIKLWRNFLLSLPYVIFGFLMIFTIDFLQKKLAFPLFAKLLVEIPVGILCYLSLVLIYWLLIKSPLISSIGLTAMPKRKSNDNN